MVAENNTDDISDMRDDVNRARVCHEYITSKFPNHNFAINITTSFVLAALEHALDTLVLANEFTPLRSKEEVIQFQITCLEGIIKGMSCKPN